MLLTTRIALRFLAALAITVVAVHGFSLDDEDDLGLSARNLGLSPYPEYTRRGFADGGDFVLSARDLEELDIRAEDISHVLVVRAGSRGGSRGGSPAGHTKKECNDKITQYKNAIKANDATMKKAKDKLKNKSISAADKKHYEAEYDSARELKGGNQDELEYWENALRSAK